MNLNETVAKAYGIHWEKIKEFADEYGWIDIKDVHPSFWKDSVEWSTHDTHWRPRALEGVEKLFYANGQPIEAQVFTKEEVVANAYIEVVGDVIHAEIKEFIDDNGYVHENKLSFTTADINPKNFDRLDFHFRPKSLRGIDDNNGWTVIYSDFNLPLDENCTYHGYNRNTKTFVKYTSAKRIGILYSEKRITHYMLVEELEEPLF